MCSHAPRGLLILTTASQTAFIIAVPIALFVVEYDYNRLVTHTDFISIHIFLLIKFGKIQLLFLKIQQNTDKKKNVTRYGF